MATIAAGAPLSSSTSHWTIRGRDGLHCKSRSVVQSLFHRELGYPYFSQDGDRSCTVITRQLFNERSPSSNETGTAVKATKVELEQSFNEHINDGQVQWTQIGVPEKTEISITDNRVWTRRKLGNVRANPNSMAKEDFYCVEPCSSSGFKCVKTLHSAATGKIKEAFVFVDRNLGTGKATTQFLTLIEPGILRAFDLVKNQLTDELMLPTNISQGLTSYTSMNVFDNSRKLFIMGTGKKLTKVIIVMNYPPWKRERKMAVIHVEIPVQITMSQGVCFLLQGKLLQITTWKMLRQTIMEIDIENRNVRLDSIQFEGKLSELPTIISKIQLSSEFFGLMEINSVPMFYGAVKTGVNIFTFHETPRVAEKFIPTSEDAEDPIEVFLFPDGSSKALICTRYSAESKIVEFQSEWVEDQREVVKSNCRLLESFSFEKYWKNLQQNDRSSNNTASTERRPRRKCADKNVNSYTPKVSILGLTYCETLHLIAALTADDEEFHIAIYEPLKLEVVKALPPVHAWPRVNDDINKRRESISNVEFIFEPDFIFINFHYSAECKPPRDVFFIRLLDEYCE